MAFAKKRLTNDYTDEPKNTNAKLPRKYLYWNIGAVPSTRPVPRCTKEGKWGVSHLVKWRVGCWGVGGLVRGLLRLSGSQLLLLEAGTWGREEFGNPEEGKISPLKPLPSNDNEDVTKNTSVCVCVCVCVSQWTVKCSHSLCVKESNKSGLQSKTRL
jgi:hypothetical protein